MGKNMIKIPKVVDFEYKDYSEDSSNTVFETNDIELRKDLYGEIINMSEKEIKEHDQMIKSFTEEITLKMLDMFLKKGEYK